MIVYDGIQLTANELAKVLIEEKGSIAIEFWDDIVGPAYEKMTERERQNVNAALERQGERVREFLNVYKIWEKMERQN